MRSRMFLLWPLFVLLTLSVGYFSCNKTGQREVRPRPGMVMDSTAESEALIQSAKWFFDRNVDLSDDSVGNGARYLPDPRTVLRKIPEWSEARVRQFSFGKGVVLPVGFEEHLSAWRNGRPLVFSATQITWLLMYRDTAGQWHIEVITRIPEEGSDSSSSSVSGVSSGSGSSSISGVSSVSGVSGKFGLFGGFQGEIRIEDWNGHFLKGYLYRGDSALFLGSSATYKKVDPMLVDPEGPSLHCTETDWYACGSVGDGPVTCTYEYTTSECSVSVGSSAGSSAPGSPTSGDYAGVGGSASGASGLASIISDDTSISNHPFVDCVYAHLMSKQLTNGLQSILSSFTGNTQYNVNFTVVPNLGEDGMCSYQGNGNFLISINGDDADDSSYSRIYLASTFIHEAFHAKLRQKALAVFGQAAINQWPKPIDDMDLSELANYFEAESKAQNIWESVEHDWMVDNIDALATSLEEFVQTYYSATYASVGSNIQAYEALMYMGLQGSTLYQEQVVATGLDTSFTEYRRLLNEGGKCQD
jgi:hypothetical protein